MNTQPLLIRDFTARQRVGGISRSTLHRWTKQGLVPAPIVVNGQNFRLASAFDEAVLKLGVTHEH